MGEVIRLTERTPKRQKLRLWWHDIVEDFDAWDKGLVAHYGGVLWDVDSAALVAKIDVDIHPAEVIRGVQLPPMCKIGLLRRFHVPPVWKGTEAEYAPLRFNGYAPLLKDVELPWRRPELPITRF